MPPKSVARLGLQALAAAGEEWEEAKLNDLVQVFGFPSVVGNSTLANTGVYSFSLAPLPGLLAQTGPGTFLVQPEYDIQPSSRFEASLGIDHLRNLQPHGLDYRKLRPDIIQAFAPGSFTEAVEPDGTITALGNNDQRIGLRVIEIKLTAQPSVPYFVEVTYYSMALAGWLVDNGFDAQFFVVPQAAVWPGSHEASRVVQVQQERQRQGATATPAELLQALEEDLEIGEFGVFAPRLRRFFQVELSTVLGTQWSQLDWHVDNRCIGCDYLGYPWPSVTPHSQHCWPLATAMDHLSRVAFVSRGVRGVLEDNSVSTVSSLANTQATSTVFDEHHILRGTRTVIAGRAQSLATGQASLPPQSGTSAVMPRWADLRIYVTADFDVGSGITMAFGWKAVWGVPQNRVSPGQQHFHAWQAAACPVDQRDMVAEERELLRLLNGINQTIQFARNACANATVQVYLWDLVTYNHLVRVIGRHLAAIVRNRMLSRLAWLFPPDTLVANPDLSNRKCPITVVREAIRSVVAAPVPHYYSLLNVAREYHSQRTQHPHNLFGTPQFFEDPLSDQIPSERAHDIWSHSVGARPWNVQLRDLERTVWVKLGALESVAQRLGDDLGRQLNQTAPRVTDLRPPRLPRRMADDARLWFIFARLNVALDQLELQKLHAMPPHERESRYKSALLVHRLTGAAEAAVLSTHNLNAQTHRLVYELGPGSREVRARAGDLGFALAPAGQPGFLERKLRTVAGSIRFPVPPWGNEWAPMNAVTQVTVKAIDRDLGHVVLDLRPDWAAAVHALEHAGVLDLSQDVMLDPVHRDFFVKRIESTLNAIGNPAVAVARPGVGQAIGASTRQPTRRNARPVADLLWNASALNGTTVSRSLGPVRSLLAANGYDLNISQWQAWDEALLHRLRLIWGPPGTGKSRVARAIVLGALHEAIQQGRTLRVLVTGPTYGAIDNVLRTLHSTLSGGGPLALPQVRVARLRSSTRIPDAWVPPGMDALTSDSDPVFSSLRHELGQNQSIVLVGGTTFQANKLVDHGSGPTNEYFDLIVVDEASQLDVATSVMALVGLAPGGSVVVAGDPRQLPPIHKAEAPIGLEEMVGSLFAYLEQRHNLRPAVLDENYRSCETIVELAHTAGYPRTLQAYSPDVQIDLVGGTSGMSSGTAPSGWPSALFWTPEWNDMLDPSKKAVCFVYEEGRSSQWNPFEADAIASLAWLLSGRLGDQLLNEREPPAGTVIVPNNRPYSPQEFWVDGIGIVTPHRAQQGLVISRLQSVFPTHPGQSIREAVDTVERFQGQQRDVMIASFALGDPDAIADEDEFLLSLNRFNVMASRARAKLIVLVSQEVVDHLSSDITVLRQSALLKSFVESYCANGRTMRLGHIRNSGVLQVEGRFRWR